MALGWIFGRGKSKKAQPSQTNITPDGEIEDDFLPRHGTFFQTLEYPVTDEHGEASGKTWMEAGYNPDTKQWVLWQRSVIEMDDVLAGDRKKVRNDKVLFEKTTFKKAYAHMTTFEKSQTSLEVAPLENKTRAKLGGDYFRQFAWRESLMNSRSGRLYPMDEKLITSAANFFNEQDFIDAKAFIDRNKKESFVEVPVVLPSIDWEKSYEAIKETADQRLRHLYSRYGDDKTNFDDGGSFDL